MTPHMTPASAILLTRAEVREFDRRAIQEFGIPGIVLMENAGRGATEHIVGAFGGTAAGRHVIACGGGNNGGDGYVVARHLVNRGVPVEVLVIGSPRRLPHDARINYDIVCRMATPMREIAGEADLPVVEESLAAASVIVDALLGTGFTGRVRGLTADVIARINARRPAARIVAIDLPSGMDCDTGLPGGVCVQADMTITFVALKAGFLQPGAPALTGRVEVVDIGAPTMLIAPDSGVPSV